ncbi:MAG TPA: methyl-accepting chemotaxis protein [Rhodocyclaceae bacterium]
MDDMNQRAASGLQIWVKLVASVAILIGAAFALLMYVAASSQHDTAIQQSHDFADSVNQMTMAQLLYMKVTKTYKERALYLEQVRESSGVHDLRILRSEANAYQMGDDDEADQRMAPMEKAALADGKARYEVMRENGKDFLMAVIPSRNVTNYLGKDCQECHDEVKADEILGAVSMKVSLDVVNQRVSASIWKNLSVAIIVLLGMVVLVYWFVKRVVTAPLQRMAQGLDEIAGGGGDLTRQLPVDSRDEIGATADSFNRMMAELRHLIAGVGRNAVEVAEATRALEAQAHGIAESSQEQSEKSAGAAAATEEMVVSIGSVAESSEEVNALSQRSRDGTERGQRSLGELEAQVGHVARAVNEIAATVERFVHSTESISRLTREVKEIADQTNLLALNAAIEAARAGEHGRGFAVVADEVRKLAEKSSRSASEIDEVTKTLHSESSSVNGAIADGLQVLDASREALGKVGEVLAESSEVVVQVAQGMDSISAATDEQKQAAHLVAQNVEAIAQLTEDNARAVDAMTKAAKGLAQLAEGLKSDMDKFKV